MSSFLTLDTEDIDLLLLALDGEARDLSFLTFDAKLMIYHLKLESRRSRIPCLTQKLEFHRF